MAKLNELATGSIFKIGNYDFIVIDPKIGLVRTRYGVSSLGGYGNFSNGSQLFNPSDVNNMGYYLNTTFFNMLPPNARAVIRTMDWGIGTLTYEEAGYASVNGYKTKPTISVETMRLKENVSKVSAKIGLLSVSQTIRYDRLFATGGAETAFNGNGRSWCITGLNNASFPYIFISNTGTFETVTASNTNQTTYPALYLPTDINIVNGEVLYNSVPTIILTAPSENKTLYENDTFNIAGTTTDADNGNTVTIRYQVNAETVRSIKAFVSDGKTLESFSKTLTFKSGKLYDGETAITGNLTDGVAHKLKVWATDDQGGTSAIIERDFYVVPNRAPSLTVEPPVINGNIDNDKFTVNGSYNDADGNTTTVKYRVNGGNGIQVASGISGAFDFDVSFAQLTAGPNAIVVEAIDSYGAKTSKTVKLNKNVVSTEQLKSTARYKILPPAKTAQAVLLWIQRDKDLTIDVAISMTMAGEAEAFVPVTVSESVAIAAGSNTYEDTFFYEADAPKDNIIVQIDMTRKSIDADDKITLISGVLE